MLVYTIGLLLAVILSFWVANTSRLSAAGMMPPADLMDMQMHSSSVGPGALRKTCKTASQFRKGRSI